MADSLLLWDIDGTLVYMDRAGERSLLVAIRELYGAISVRICRSICADAPTRPSCAICSIGSACR
jgi:beta-phosphoglucomutase-like phosphatase (HAD superfamily)